MARTPAVGSRWQHRNGNRYRVLALANTDSDNHEKYPPTVVYRGPNGKVWSRRLSDWERSFTALPPATEPSPTEGMNIAQRILHVGGRNTAGGYIEFGSIQAVEALVRQVLRDLSSELLAFQSSESFEEWAVRQFAVPSVDHLKEKVYSHAFVAAMELAWNAAKPAQSDRLLELADELDEQLTSGAGTDMQDAYVGAREDLAIWKRRALEAERDLRAERETASRIAAEINATNGPTRMGEPAAPPQPCSFGSPELQAMILAKCIEKDRADSVTAPADGANWQDISTAPKDGTRFVAVGNNYGRYSETQHTCIAQWFRGCWMEVSDWNEASELKYLTHWMPLPPLPGSAASATANSVTAPAGGMGDDVDAIALARYKVVPAHESMFHRFAVVAGDGKQQLYLGREVECENMARKFAGAFLDGAFYQSNIATTPPAKAADSVLEDAARTLIEAIEYTPLGVRAITAMNQVRVAIAVRKQGVRDAG